MKLIITGRHMHVSHHLEEYITSKSEKLGKHMPALTEVRVEVMVDESRVSNEHFSCQFTTTVDHRVLQATESAADIHGAVNGAIAKLDRQLGKVKVQHQHKGRLSVADAEQLLSEQLS